MQGKPVHTNDAPQNAMPDQDAIWSQRYQATGDDYLFGTAPNRFLEQRRALFKAGQSALCVADGEGRNSVWLAEQQLSVTALEITSVATARARRLAAARGVALVCETNDMLAPTWPPPTQQNAFDWVIAIFVQFAGPQQRPQQMAAMQCAVKPGGRILLQGYTPKQVSYGTGGPSAVANMYTSAMLRQFFADWLIEELIEYEDDIAEGQGHHGRSALIGLVARKPL